MVFSVSHSLEIIATKIETVRQDLGVRSRTLIRLPKLVCTSKVQFSDILSPEIKNELEMNIQSWCTSSKQSNCGTWISVSFVEKSFPDFRSQRKTVDCGRQSQLLRRYTGLIIASSALYVYRTTNFTCPKVSVSAWFCLCVCHTFLNKTHALKVN